MVATTGASLTGVIVVESGTVAAEYGLVPPVAPDPLRFAVEPVATAPAELSISRTVSPPGVPL